jgi:hypothetical protein
MWKKENKQQMLVGMWGKMTYISCWWENKLVQSLWKSQ